MSSKLVNQRKKILLNGILGVFKERGDSVDDYKTWIRLTHYLESRIEDKSIPFETPALIVDVNPRYAEPFTTGVLCVGIGTWAAKLTALCQFWPHEWLVSAKLGTETQHYCIDSPVVKEMPFNHINESLLKETINHFIGSKPQIRPPTVWKESLLIPKRPLRTTQVTPVLETAPAVRIRECVSIDVLSFKPPELTLRVLTNGAFSCRSFVNDLGHRLNCCAHITDLSLVRMGDITPEHCLKKYELHLNEISEAIDKYSKIYSKQLKKYENLSQSKRRFI